MEKQRLLEEKVSMYEHQLPCLFGWAQPPSTVRQGGEVCCLAGSLDEGLLNQAWGGVASVHSHPIGATALWVPRGMFFPSRS